MRAAKIANEIIDAGTCAAVAIVLGIELGTVVRPPDQIKSVAPTDHASWS